MKKHFAVALIAALIAAPALARDRLSVFDSPTHDANNPDPPDYAVLKVRFPGCGDSEQETLMAQAIVKGDKATIAKMLKYKSPMDGGAECDMIPKGDQIRIILYAPLFRTVQARVSMAAGGWLVFLPRAYVHVEKHHPQVEQSWKQRNTMPKLPRNPKIPGQ